MAASPESAWELVGGAVPSPKQKVGRSAVWKAPTGSWTWLGRQACIWQLPRCSVWELVVGGSQRVASWLDWFNPWGEWGMS